MQDVMISQELRIKERAGIIKSMRDAKRGFFQVQRKSRSNRLIKSFLNRSGFNLFKFCLINNKMNIMQVPLFQVPISVYG
jgi:hypothetical protein